MKMTDRNAQLKAALGPMALKERVAEVINIKSEDTVNRQGFKAYALDDKLRLIAMLNTLKLQPQFYRTESDQMKELRDLIERIAIKDAYFVAQAIVYSRCVGEGMRSVNHLAAALLAPYASGQEWSKRFYGLFNKKESKNGLITGGCIYRPDDMTEIKAVYDALNKTILSNAMKKGFASVIENLDGYQLTKYKKNIIDMSNLVHPNSSKSKATVTIDGKTVKVLDALMKGINIPADTWEHANSEAGQEVAKAVREGKINKNEAEKILAEAKNDNWESLLTDGKLGVLAALRNIRNMMKNPRKSVIDAWCKLITTDGFIRKSLVLPTQIDLAYDTVIREFANADYSPQVQQALLDAYEMSIPNLTSVLSGKTCVIVDCSGSMGCAVNINGDYNNRGYWWYSPEHANESCSYKAGLIAATICKATNADVIKFGSDAKYFGYNKNTNVFALAKQIGTCEYGATYPYKAFELMRNARKSYDRIIFISDNEVNSNNLTSNSYRRYIHDICSPYIYAVDLAAYGTTPINNDYKIQYYYGYGNQLFEDISKNEFDPNYHIDKISKVVI